MFKNINKHYLTLHLIVFLWGWTPILGKVIQVGAMPLVWFRILITAIISGIYLVVTKDKIQLSKKQWLQYSFVGLLICIHWLCFYQGIKSSNVSATLMGFSTCVVFTSIFEPLFYKKPFVQYEIAIGIITIGIITFMYRLEPSNSVGIAFGTAAAFLGSIFSTLNGKFILNKNNSTSAAVISFVEMLAMLIGLSIYLGFSGYFNQTFFVLTGSDFFYILLLAGVCTVFPFIISINLMKHISPYTANLTLNLEGFYGIILAAFLFKENKILTPTFYICFGCIVLLIYINALIKKRIHKQNT